MIILDKKYYPFKEVINSFADHVINYKQLTIFEQSELLIALYDLQIPIEFYQNLLTTVVEYNPDIPLNQDVLNQLNRYWAITKYQLSEEERRRFVRYWLKKENRRKIGDDFIMLSWILIIIVDNKDLLSVKEFEKVKQLVCENASKTKAMALKCLWPRTVEILDFRELSENLIEEIFQEKERNGSWYGDLSKSLRIGYHLLNSNAGQQHNFKDLLEFVKGKIERGFSSKTIIVAEIIKFVHKIHNSDVGLSDYVLFQIKQLKGKSLEKAINYIRRGNLGLAIDSIMDNLVDSNDKKWIEILKSRISRVDYDYRIGIITLESAKVEKNKITESLLELLNNLK